MKFYEAGADIGAPPETVWAILADGPPTQDNTLLALERSGTLLHRVSAVWQDARAGRCRWHAQVGHPLGFLDAAYAGEITLDLSQVTPHLSGPDSVQVMASLAELADSIRVRGILSWNAPPPYFLIAVFMKDSNTGPQKSPPLAPSPRVRG